MTEWSFHYHIQTRKVLHLSQLSLVKYDTQKTNKQTSPMQIGSSYSLKKKKVPRTREPHILFRRNWPRRLFRSIPERNDLASQILLTHQLTKTLYRRSNSEGSELEFRYTWTVVQKALNWLETRLTAIIGKIDSNSYIILTTDTTPNISSTTKPLRFSIHPDSFPINKPGQYSPSQRKWMQKKISTA